MDINWNSAPEGAREAWQAYEQSREEADAAACAFYNAKLVGTRYDNLRNRFNEASPEAVTMYERYTFSGPRIPNQPGRFTKYASTNYPVATWQKATKQFRTWTKRFNKAVQDA